MKAITIRLEAAEQAPIQQHAEVLGVTPEDIAYAALQKFMQELAAHPKTTDAEIIHSRDIRQHNGPIWGTSGHTSHPFENVDDNDYAVPGL